MDKLRPTGQAPRLGDSYARPDVIADPLNSVARLSTRKKVEAELRPVGEPLRQLNGLMQLVLSGIDAVDGVLLARGSEVRMQFHHQSLRCDRLRAVYLNLVVALRVCQTGQEQQ
jgi:hypothetical protein